MDKATALAHAQKFADKIREQFDPIAIVLYGSYATENQTENSDIDIAVIFRNFSGDFLQASAKLYQLTCDIDTAIEPIILDLENDNSGFAEQVMKHGQKIA